YFYPDPTFETGQSDYFAFPLTVGNRWSLTHPRPGDEFRMYLGAGSALAYSRFRISNSSSGSSVLMGAFFELRPQFQLGRRCHLWSAARLMPITDLGRSSGPDFSNISWQAGLSYKL